MLVLAVHSLWIPAVLAKAWLRVYLRYRLLLIISVLYYWRLILITIWESRTDQMWRQKPLLWMWSPIRSIGRRERVVYIWLRVIGLIWIILLLLPCAVGIWQPHNFWILGNFRRGFDLICLFLSHCQDLLINCQCSICKNTVCLI